MQRVGGRLVLSATDLTKHVACAHVTTLDLAELDRPDDPATPVAAAPDDALALVFAKGLDHERAYLDRLEARGAELVRIASTGLAGADETVAAMRAGAEVISQAALYDGSWVGYADVLLRVDSEDEPSLFGPWRYDIADTKLARHLDVAALLQMATYAERLTRLQGVEPRRLVVVTGDGAEHPWALRDVRAYARRLSRRLTGAVAQTALTGPETEPAPVAHCAVCRWSTHCASVWAATDDLALVGGLRGDERAALRAAGVDTLAGLAAADPAALVPPLSRSAATRLAGQARLQVAERETGSPVYELLEPGPGAGLARLPRPHPADVYLDFEGDPWAEGGEGREYLAGLGDRGGAFTARWAHDRDDERRLTEELLDDLTARLAANPGMHVYHYAPYERSALARLTGRHGTREAAFDDLLRAGALVDLYAVVRQGVRVSRPSSSIKELEAFYWGAGRAGGEGEVGDALSSVVEYERWLAARPDEGSRADPDGVLAAIERYNAEDVRSTLALHDWLEERRDELLAAGHDVPRPGPEDEEAEPEPGTSAAAEQEPAEARLAERLHAAGEPLLAACVGWHRREQRPQWWEYFRFAEASVDELVDDPHALGGLGEPVHVRDVTTATGRVTSKVWRYPMPPQEYSQPVGKALPCVDTGASLGTLVDLDAQEGWAEFKRKASLEPALTRGAGVPAPIGDKVLREAIFRAGELRLSGGGSMATRLVAPVVPDASTLAARGGESPADVVVRVGRGLAGQVLAVQGPPGTGKTTAASRLVRALLDDGRTVGVTALSHTVIDTVLDAVERPAVQKVAGARTGPDGSPRTRRGDVEEVTDNGVVARRLAEGETRLVGGTAWLWAREEMAESVDVLVVDEAGQFSLANAVAVAGAARSLVLLGDPQQLTQPTQATHPDGGEVSALQHLIGPHDTMPPDRGVFLDTTWRMHPDIAAFVSDLSYEGRLRSRPERAVQRVEARGALSGSGLRWVPVDHRGNVADSPEEADVVATLLDDLLAGSWTDQDDVWQPMSLGEVLVVAPFNAHVERLRAALPEGARVGTVDRFQGQEAAVVVYAMGSSSADLAPRGVGFLYDLHRLNVAVSRAKALAVVVASPALLDAPVTTPRALRQVNALCGFADRARTVAARGNDTRRRDPAPDPRP